MFFFSRKRKGEQLVKLEQFEMFVDSSDQGISQFLIKRAEKLKRGKELGPEREPDFNWILRSEVEELAEIFAGRKERLVIYDIGANLGLNTLIIDQVLKRKLPSEKYIIIAIEPQQKTASLLHKNISHNFANAKIFSCAISDYNGEGQFHISSHSNLGSLWAHSSTGMGFENVPVFTLPAFAESSGTGFPHLLKMDIEGGEVEVLKGGRDWLAHCPAPCKILMEVHPMMYNESRSLEKELRFLFENGWVGKYMVSAGVAQPELFKQAGLCPFVEFDTGRHIRGIYRDFPQELLLDFACHEHIQELAGQKPSRKIVRAVLIEKRA